MLKNATTQQTAGRDAEPAASAEANGTAADTTTQTAAPATARPIRQPEPPFPAQHQDPPGLESELNPEPRWKGERYKPAGKLEGMVALVTGGDSGIGRSVAYHFAMEGADVAITCLERERSDAETVQRAIEKLGRRCEILFANFENADRCDGVVDETVETLGRLDIVVHNAAWQNRKPLDALSDEELERTLQVNVQAYLRLARAAVEYLQPGSSIIATGSVVGLSGSAELSDYGATKGAIHSITKCLAAELIDKRIRVNCVAPGPVWTPLNPSDTGLDPEEVATFGSEVGSSPMGRPAQPEELAPAYVYFASNADSGYVTGAVLPITGGPV